MGVIPGRRHVIYSHFDDDDVRHLPFEGPLARVTPEVLSKRLAAGEITPAICDCASVPH